MHAASLETVEQGAAMVRAAGSALRRLVVALALASALLIGHLAATARPASAESKETTAPLWQTIGTWPRFLPDDPEQMTPWWRRASPIGMLRIMRPGKWGELDNASTCTATIVDDRHVLTSYHCVEPKVHEKQIAIWFHVDYYFEEGQQNTDQRPKRYRVDLEKFQSNLGTYADENLDFAILPIASFKGDENSDFVPLSNYGAVSFNVLKGDSLPHHAGLFIIHHPGPESKKVTTFKCFYSTDCKGLPVVRFGHTCDTAPGSSGALVFTDHEFPQIIGIHAKGGLNRNQDSCNAAVPITHILAKNGLLKKLAEGFKLPTAKVNPPPPALVTRMEGRSYQLISAFSSDSPIRQLAASVVFFIIKEGDDIAGACTGVHIGQNLILTTSDCTPIPAHAAQYTFTVAFGDATNGWRFEGTDLKVDLGDTKQYPATLEEWSENESYAILKLQTPDNITSLYGFQDLGSARDLLPRYDSEILQRRDIFRLMEYDRAVPEGLFSIFFTPDGKKVLSTNSCAGFIGSMPPSELALRVGQPVVFNNCVTPTGSSGALFYSLQSAIPVGMVMGSIPTRRSRPSLRFSELAVPIGSIIAASNSIKATLARSWNVSLDVILKYAKDKTDIAEIDPREFDGMLYEGIAHPYGALAEYWLLKNLEQTKIETMGKGLPIPRGLQHLSKQIAHTDLYRVRMIATSRSDESVLIGKTRIDRLRSALAAVGLSNVSEAVSLTTPATTPEERSTVRLTIETSGLYPVLRSSAPTWLSEQSSRNRIQTGSTKKQQGAPK